MNSYLELLKRVINEGEPHEDRTGVGTKRLFGTQLSFTFDGLSIPVITTKYIHLKSVIVELLWFLSGDTNIKYLKENNVNIWDEWADENGDLGPIYGMQWRHWRNDGMGSGIDQISNILSQLIHNPKSRRIILNSWNVSDIDKMSLPPCHVMCQFSVNASGGIITHLYQRSADIFLGVPFNITSYAILTRLLAMYSGLRAERIIITFGDLHIYTNHLEQANLQLTREPYLPPSLTIEKQSSIFEHSYQDFEIQDYNYHPHIKASVAV